MNNMEKFNTKKYKALAVIAIGTSALMGSQLHANASDKAPLKRNTSPPDITPQSNQYSGRVKFASHLKPLIEAASSTKQTAVESLKPAPKKISKSYDIAVKPNKPSGITSQGHSENVASVPIGDYWFGGNAYFNGLRYKAKHGHPEVFHNAQVVYEVGKAEGLSDDEIGDLQKIGYRESGLIAGPDSITGTAYGIPQATPGDKMASAGADWRTNPATQIKWMINYVDHAYGGPAQAWEFWQQHQWY